MRCNEIARCYNIRNGLIQSATYIGEVSIALLDPYFVYQENLSKHAHPRNKTPLIRTLGRDHNIDFGIKIRNFFFFLLEKGVLLGQVKG